MNSAPQATPSGRDDVLAILLVAAAAGGLGYLAAKKLAMRGPTPRLPQHAVLVEQPLKAIASQAGIQPPTALAHLRKLEAEGKVQRVDLPQGPRYAVLPSLRCEWIDPDHGMHDTWQAQTVDWRFPLVTRVRDDRAQAFLVEWLDRAQARGLLPPFRSRFEPGKHPLLQVVVHGSCARGDAGPNSDLDLLLTGNLAKRTADALVDLAHEVALGPDVRRPDVRVVGDQAWASATPSFKANVRREGKTVFTNDYDAPFLERPLDAFVA